MNTIDNKYEVVEMLGEGGFSQVYLVDGPYGRCALKLLKGTLASLKSTTLDEFKHEFQILKNMCHPNISSILDFGFDEKIEQYYYTSEFIDGKNFIKVAESLPPEEITHLIVQTLRSLAYLHSYRIYHFDIKAANVLVMGKENPLVKLIDFGLAGIDPNGRRIGTPSYMAPEIVARDKVDGRADLYSLGVLWYAALTQKNPFFANDRNEILRRQLQLIPPPPSNYVSTIPKWIDSIILRLLEKNPLNRYYSASVVIKEINHLGGYDYPLETKETLISYLPNEGRFIGRTMELKRIEEEIDGYRKVNGNGSGCLVIGGAGLGKTRFLRELKYSLQLKDTRVVWASSSKIDDFNEWCDELSSHMANGTGFKIFMLDDGQEAIKDQLMRSRLISLVARLHRPNSESSLFLIFCLKSLDDEESTTSLKTLLPLHIALRQFSMDEVKEYLVSLTGLDDPPQSLLQNIFRRTEGNPLFLTELLKSLIENGALFDEKGRWNESLFEDVGVDYTKARLPKNIGEILLKKIESLSDEAKRIAIILSVIGRGSTLIELERVSEISNSNEAIKELLQHEIVDRLEGFQFDFHNSLLAKTIYESLGEDEKKSLHDLIAKCFYEIGKPEEEVLWHVSLGKDNRSAFEAAIRLGDLALRSGRGEKAVRFIKRAIERIGVGEGEKYVSIQMMLGEAYLISHNYDDASRQFEVVEKILAEFSESPSTANWRMQALIRLGGTLIKMQEFERAVNVLRNAEIALQEIQVDGYQKIIIKNFFGSIAFLEGNLGQAYEIFIDTKDEAKKLTMEESSKITNNDLGIVLIALNKLDEAEIILKDDFEIASRIQDDLLIARAYYNIAQLKSARRLYLEAIESYEKSAMVCRRSHNSELLLRVYNGLGNIYQIVSDFDKSIEFYERGLTLHERTADLRGGATISVNMGVVESKRDRKTRAMDYIIPAVDYLKSIPNKTASDWATLCRGLLELGDILTKDGQIETAKLYLDGALDISENIPNAAVQRFWVLKLFADVARQEGKTGEFDRIISELNQLAKSEEEKTTLKELF